MYTRKTDPLLNDLRSETINLKTICEKIWGQDYRSILYGRVCKLKSKWNFAIDLRVRWFDIMVYLLGGRREARGERPSSGLGWAGLGWAGLG